MSRFFTAYLARLQKAPASYLTSFLVLHELTAIVPLPILYYTISTTEIQIPVPEASLEEAMGAMRRVMVRYGWMSRAENNERVQNSAYADAVDSVDSSTAITTISTENGTPNSSIPIPPASTTLISQNQDRPPSASVSVFSKQEQAQRNDSEKIDTSVISRGGMNNDGVVVQQNVGVSPRRQSSNNAQVLVNLATSYAVVKILMPVRVAASFALTPWFARTVVSPVFLWLKR